MPDHSAADATTASPPLVAGRRPRRRGAGPTPSGLPRPSATAGPLLLLVTLLACGDDPSGPASPGEPASLVLSADTVRLAAIGATAQLTAAVSDANGLAIGDAAVTWSSADEAVATVDGSGRVEAVGAGETEVTASAGDASDTATVVVDQTAASVSVSPALSELHAIGDSARLSATVRDANGNAIEGAAVEWTSADEGVATVDAAGWVTARANGTATVTAAAGGVSDEAAVVVEQVAASVEVSPAADTLAEGDVVQLEAAVFDSNGVAIADAAVSWTSSRAEIVAVDTAGTAQAVGWGDAAVTVTATAGDANGSAELEVLGQLAFVRFTTTDGTLNDEIFVANVDGGGTANRTNDVFGDAEPAWSPDGTRIAFSSDRNPGDGTYDREIWVMDADGSSASPLTGTASDDREPAWSPDGSRIAFVSDRDPGDGTTDFEVWVVDADGSAPVRLTANTAADRSPAWSPDGSKIAFVSRQDPGDGTTDFEVWVVNVDGSDPTPLTAIAGNQEAPAWSPDGSEIAFVSGSEIWVMNADGSDPTQLTDNGAVDDEPAWSSDGGRIAFRSNRDGDDEIYVMDADGSAVVQVTDNPGFDGDPAWRSRP